MPKTRFNFWIEPAQLEGLRQVQDQTGATPSAQVRLAIWRWLEAQGIVQKAGRKRAATRKRP